MRKVDIFLAYNNLEKAFNKLSEAIPKVEDELDRDGVIQRFEFVVELLWKVLKLVLNYQGIDCASPRRCVKEAFKAGVINDDDIFLDMLEDRNKTSHIYDESESLKIFERIKSVYVKSLDGILERIRSFIEEG